MEPQRWQPPGDGSGRPRAGNSQTPLEGSMEPFEDNLQLVATGPPPAISITKGRVGAPPVRPLPLEARQISRYDPKYVPNSSAHARILRTALRILDEYGIRKPHNPTIGEEVFEADFDQEAWGGEVVLDEWHGRAELVLRSHPHETPGPQHLTLLMEAEWDPSASSRRWQRAVLDCKAFLERMFQSGEIGINVGVEMISTDLTRPFEEVDLGPEYHDLQAEWPRLQHRIRGIIESFSFSKGRSRRIGIANRRFVGPDEDWKTTAYVYLDEKCPEHLWTPLETRILSLLRSQVCTQAVVVSINHAYGHQDLAFDLVRLDSKSYDHTLLAYKNMSCFKPFTNYSAEMKVGMGAAIGPATQVPILIDGKVKKGPGKNPPFGTLGCLLAVRETPKSQPRLVGLANYHVVREGLGGVMAGFKADGEAELLKPQHGTLAQRVDADGVTRDELEKHDGGHQFQIENPPRRIHAVHVAQLESGNRPGRNIHASLAAKSQANLREKTAWFDAGKNELGRLIAASGFLRRSEVSATVQAKVPDGLPRNRRLDWALFEVDPRRRGTNVLPTWSDFKTAQQDSAHDYPSDQRQFLHHKGGGGMDDLLNGGTVYKMGAVTGATVGEVGVYRDLVNYEPDEHLGAEPSYEIVVRGITTGNGVNKEGHPFGLQGDSGSVVWSADGRALGMLFRGHPPKQNINGYCYVTPMEDILEDIKKCTGWDVWVPNQ